MNASSARSESQPGAPTPAPRKRRAKSLLLGLAFGLGGAACGWLGGRLATQDGWVASRLDALGAVDLLALPVSIFLVLLVHELGHLAGGMARGMRFVLLIVGPFRLRRTVSGIKLDWFLRGDTFGGMAAALPDMRRPTRGQLLPMIVGGPLASLLLAAVALAAAAVTEGRLSAYLTILGLLSIPIFVVTALPMRAGGFLSDGRQLLDLLRGGRGVEQRAMLIAAYAEALSGVRPRDRDPVPLERALAMRGDEPLRDVSAAMMAYQVALDRRELAAAGEWIDVLAEGHDAYPGGFRQSIACDIAYFAARYRHDPATAAVWYARAKGGMAEKSQLAMAEAAIALATGDATGALRAVERGVRHLGDIGDAGSVPLVVDELALLRADADAMAKANPAGIAGAQALSAAG